MKSFDTYIQEKREALAELEHEQWIAWSKDIAETEQITEARLERWKELWCPYSELTEAQKDQDREWADKVLAILDVRTTAREMLEAVLPEERQNHMFCCGYTPDVGDKEFNDCRTAILSAAKERWIEL